MFMREKHVHDVSKKSLHSLGLKILNFYEWCVWSCVSCLCTLCIKPKLFVYIDHVDVEIFEIGGSYATIRWKSQILKFIFYFSGFNGTEIESKYIMYMILTWLKWKQQVIKSTDNISATVK